MSEREPRNGTEDIARMLRRHGQPSEAMFLAAEAYDRLGARIEEGKRMTDTPMRERLIQAAGKELAGVNGQMRIAVNIVDALLAVLERPSEKACRAALGLSTVTSEIAFRAMVKAIRGGA